MTITAACEPRFAPPCPRSLGSAAKYTSSEMQPLTSQKSTCARRWLARYARSSTLPINRRRSGCCERWLTAIAKQPLAWLSAGGQHPRRTKRLPGASRASAPASDIKPARASQPRTQTSHSRRISISQRGQRAAPRFRRPSRDIRRMGVRPGLSLHGDRLRSSPHEIPDLLLLYLGPRYRDGQSPRANLAYRDESLLLRSSKPMAARNQREHEPTSEAVFPERNSSKSTFASRARPGCSEAKSEAKKEASVRLPRECAKEAAVALTS